MCLLDFFSFIAGRCPEPLFGTTNIQLKKRFFVFGWTNFIEYFFDISWIFWPTIAVSSWLIEIEVEDPVWDGSETNRFWYPFTNSKMKGSLMNFSQFFRKGNTEDTLLIEYSLHCLHVTNFLSLDVCEDSFVDCVFLYYAEETEFEKSCLPLLPFAKLVPYLFVGCLVSRDLSKQFY